MKYDAIILTDTKTEHRLRPLGAYVIANSLRQQGYTCLVLDFFTDMEREDLFFLLESFIGSNTVFVGYSSSLLFKADESFNYLGVDKEYFKEINRRIKSINQKTQIIFGGAYTPHFSEYCLRTGDNMFVDYLFHGYSESMIKDFMEKYNSGKSQKFSKKNFGLYEIDYDYQGNSFSFSGESFSWTKEDLIFEHEALPIELSRGCIFKCKFCAYPLLGKNKNDLSYLKTEDNILKEITENYQNYGTLNYQIVDDTFNERIDKLETLLRVRDKSKLDLSFVGYNRLDLIHRFPEQISLFKDLNFKGHFFGIETLNYESAKIIGKGLKEKDATETLYKIKESMNGKVNIASGFIVGLPKENIHTFSDWFLKVLHKDYPIDSILLNALWLSQSTHTKSEFFKNPEKYGYSFESKLLNENYSASIWKNQYWKQTDCLKLVNDFKRVMFENGRNKISSFVSVGLSSHTDGDLDSLLNIPEKEIDYNFYQEKHLKKVKKYVDRLKDLC